jgi:selenocysteine lyase/cysteine desulfurase
VGLRVQYALWLLGYGWFRFLGEQQGDRILGEGDEIVITEMEHHANLVRGRSSPGARVPPAMDGVTDDGRPDPRPGTR